MVPFILSAALVFPAVADDAAPTPRRSLPTAVDTTTDTVARTATTSRVAIPRTTISATTAADTAAGTDTVRGNAATVRSAVSRATVAGDTPSMRERMEATINTSGRSARTVAASINSTAAARRAGISLRPSTAEVGGRARIAGTDEQTGSNMDFGTQSRSVQTRAATISINNTSAPVASVKTNANAGETIAAAKERLDQTADLNKSCQQQYNDCMDQFCSVIDANQKRCSCSANLKNYTKVETAVKDANTQLNEVAQRIRYIGLSADEIRAIMSATEAEETLSGTRDNTESRSMLDQIEALIKNPTNTTAAVADTSIGLDMNLDFSNSSDMFNLDFLNTNSSSSFSNLRGTELYNAAKSRCNTVLTQCKGAGATTTQITGNYDLAIDKDCIAYEQGLAKMNDTLKSNVRSANLMLQKARLAVLQNKNQYDAKGCISALNTCMTDDMVCGADYTKCLDPTKRYIYENGQVVLGQRISDITDFMGCYNNAAIDVEFLSATSSMTIKAEDCKREKTYTEGDKTINCGEGKCVAKYLLTKIGTGATVKDGGLCRAVLDKCQDVSYKNGSYQPYNDVVVNYIQRAMVNISAAQHKIISDYASSCMTDIATCYNQQVSQVNAWSSTASVNSVYNVMRGACRNVALTCAYAVFASNTDLCPVAASSADTCINSISEMFYQSLLCPENSHYVEGGKADTTNNGDVTNWVNDRCACDTYYTVWGSTCTRQCSAGTYRNTLTGLCDACAKGSYSTTTEAASCTPCSSGTTTEGTGASSSADCK
jgi:hypothetical protein